MNKSNYEKVLEVFFDNPNGKFYIREIARITKLNPNTILNITNKLEKQELIKREKKKYIVELSANFNDNFKQLKRISNFERLIKSRIIEFLNYKFSPEVIVVIGSYSLGEDIPNSDIDLVILTKKDYTDINLNKFEKELNRKIHLIITGYNKISDEFYTNLINGIVLYGAIRKK